MNQILTYIAGVLVVGVVGFFALRGQDHSGYGQQTATINKTAIPETKPKTTTKAYTTWQEYMAASQAEGWHYDIADYIAENNPNRAETFIHEIVGHCHRLCNMPHVGRARLELGHDIRSIPHGGYVIFYRVAVSEVEIVRVLHGARDIQRLF